MWWNERDLIFEIFKITFIRNMRKNKLCENCYWIWIKNIKLIILVYRVCSELEDQNADNKIYQASKCWYIDKITDIPDNLPKLSLLSSKLSRFQCNEQSPQVNNYNTHLSKQPKLGLSDFSQVISFIRQTCLDYRLCHIYLSSDHKSKCSEILKFSINNLFIFI